MLFYLKYGIVLNVDNVNCLSKWGVYARYKNANLPQGLRNIEFYKGCKGIKYYAAGRIAAHQILGRVLRQEVVST